MFRRFTTGLSVLALVGLATSSLACSGAAPEGDPEGSTDQDVVTARCPAALHAKLTDIVPMTFDEMARDRGFDFSQDERDSLAPELAKLKALASYEVELVLASKANAQCQYQAPKGSKVETTAKFYTSSGRKILRIDAQDSQATGWSFYITVNDYTADGWSLKPGTDSLVILRDGNTDMAFFRVDIGHAFSVALTPELAR